MSDLVNPPEYVPYPRDPKFRGFDEIDRLESVGKGYLGLTFPAILTLGLLNYQLDLKSVNGGIGLGFYFLLLSMVFLQLKSVLEKIALGKGWRDECAFVGSLLLCAASVGILLLPLHFASRLVLFYFIWLAFAFALQRIAAAEFKKFGLKMGFGFDSAKLSKIIRELRQKESDVVPFNVP